jgi:hypothetical protein
MDSTDWYVAFITYINTDGTVSVMGFGPDALVFNVYIAPYDNTGATLPSWRYLDAGT